jgi:hypothetical protein
MALKDIAVVTGHHSEEGVLVEFWDGATRRIAVIQRSALDDTFDKLLPFGSPQRRIAVSQWNRVVQENIVAFERIIEAQYRPWPVDRVEINLQNIQESGEEFAGEALRDMGIQRR